MRAGFAVFTAIAAVALGPVPVATQPRPEEGCRIVRPISVGEPVTAFVNVSVIPMDRERVLPRQTVVVQGDRIVALGPADRVRVPDNAVRIDGRGKFLMPGLADMHMHIGLNLADVKDAEQILFLLVANGVTTIRNLDCRPGNLGGEAALQLRARVAAGELWGPRIYTAGPWYTDTSKSVLQNVEAYKAAGYDLIKVKNDPLTKLDSLVEAAQRVGIPIAGHAVGGLAYALEHRFASLEHLDGFLYTDTSKISALVAATREAGVRITPTRALIEALTLWSADPRYYQGQRYLPAALSLYSYADPDSVAARRARSKSLEAEQTAEGAAARRLRLMIKEDVEVGRRYILALQAAGVELLLGTDSPLLVPGYGVHQELDALVRAGLTPYQALVTGTRNVAAYFGTLDSTGTVAAGKRADLVLLAANPLTDIRHSEHITGVMAAGRWLSAADIKRRLDQYAKAAAKPTGD